MKELIDISVSLEEDIPAWPGSCGFSMSPTSVLDGKGHSNNSRIEMDVHVGTHIDAPWHFVPGGKTVEQLELDKLVGSVYVADFPGASEINRGMLEEATVPGEITRLLLKTDNSQLWSQQERNFKPDYVALTPDAAAWLVEKNFVLVGIDYLSIQKFNDSSLTHEILLEAEIIIVEGLDLSHVSRGTYEIYCLPLKLAGADGAPARVLLREI